MREIKFRAQDIASNKWLFGDLRHHKDDVCIFDQGGTKGEQVKCETVGQYTGLKDKNDKPIYEGDIVECVSWNEYFTNPATGEVMQPVRRKMFVDFRKVASRWWSQCRMGLKCASGTSSTTATSKSSEISTTILNY